MLTKWHVLLGSLLAVGAGHAQAHDIYLDVMDASGQSCCDNRHCRPAPYRVTSSGVRMFVQGQWLNVPDDKIQYRAILNDTGETAGGHWCGSWQQGPNYIFHATRCAILPPNSASASDILQPRLPVP
jgi:hypothetical protein